jgi:predicted ATPase/DNA-binding CsgD family transcriptional regulator/Tfp pilus assembly protein PilF
VTAPVLRVVPERAPFPPTLPATATPLVGRTNELAEIRAAVRDGAHRLVTISGTGGVGKTRLAIEAGRSLRGEFAEAVLFVPLAFVAEPDAVAAQIAHRAGWDTDSANAAARARSELATQPTLLILDNVEQIAGVEEIVADLLHHCPELVVLATTRRALRIAAEHVISVEALPTPDPQAPTRELARNDAVALIANAVRRSNPKFEVTAGNAADLAELCVQLDGLPLALELAAARLHLVTPGEMIGLLARRFDVLRSSARDVVPHHQRLWATIDWSYKMLSDTDQRRFRLLGVFPDSFDLDAAAKVAGSDPADMLDTVDTLVAHHLVRTGDAVTGTGRFALLVTIREFALAQLDASGELDGALSAHAEWCAALGEWAAPRLVDPAQTEPALARLEAERENLWAALEWATAAAPDLALAIGSHPWRFWSSTGYSSAVVGRLATILDADPPRSHLVATAYNAAGALADEWGDLAKASGYLERAVDMFGEFGSPIELAGAQANLAHALRERGDLERADELYTAARLGFREGGGPRGRRGEAVVLNGLGALAYRRGNFAAAGEQWEAALAILAEIGDRRSEILLAGNAGIARFGCGDFAGAIEFYDRSIALCAELGNRAWAQSNLMNRAEALVELGRYDDALADLSRATEIALETGNRYSLFIVDRQRGLLADRQGRIGEALEMFARSMAGMVADSRTLEFVDLIEFGALIAADLGDDDHAVRWLAAARAIRTETGSSPTAQYEQALREIAARLGGEPAPAPADPAAVLDEMRAVARRHANAVRLRPPGKPADDPLRALGLSAREAEVARLVVARLTDREIADELFIGVRTVATHVSAVLRKLGVSRRRGVATRLAELGIELAGPD